MTGKSELFSALRNRSAIVIRLQKMLAARRENNQERAGEMLRPRESDKGPCAVKRPKRDLCRFFQICAKAEQGKAGKARTLP